MTPTLLGGLLGSPPLVPSLQPNAKCLLKCCAERICRRCGDSHGVPSLSVLDGWWIEGHVEDVTGWSIGDRIVACMEPRGGTDVCHAAALYDKLERKVVPCFYKERERFVEIMRQAIALNGGFFNTQRMMAQYLHNAYRLVGEYVRRG